MVGVVDLVAAVVGGGAWVVVVGAAVVGGGCVVVGRVGSEVAGGTVVVLDSLVSSTSPSAPHAAGKNMPMRIRRPTVVLRAERGQVRKSRHAAARPP